MVATLEDSLDTIKVLSNAVSTSRALVSLSFVHDTEALGNKRFQLGKEVLLDLVGETGLVVELVEEEGENGLDSIGVLGEVVIVAAALYLCPELCCLVVAAHGALWAVG